LPLLLIVIDSKKSTAGDKNVLKISEVVYIQ